jgi:hypothetical protein
MLRLALDGMHEIYNDRARARITVTSEHRLHVWADHQS